jgi:hypothetical protein
MTFLKRWTGNKVLGSHPFQGFPEIFSMDKQAGIPVPEERSKF